MEYFDLYSANREPLGRRVMRGDPIQQGEYHIVVQVMTINRKGEILLTQRVPEKTSGGKWECSGGCAVSGESSRAAAVRELFEETGIRAFESELFLEWSLITDSMIRDFYILVKDVPLSALHLQGAEVCAAKWVSFDRLYEMSRLGQTTRTIARWIGSRYRELKYLTSRAAPDRYNGYDRGSGYNRDNSSYNRNNGYNRGSGYNRDNGYNRGNGYNRNNGYNRGGYGYRGRYADNDY